MKVLAWIFSVIMLCGVVSCSEASCDTNSIDDKQPIHSEDDNGNISEDEISGLMDHYLTYEYYTVYESMEVNPLQSDDSGVYFAVTNEEYDTWEEWTSFCESIFYGNALKKAIDEVKSLKNIEGKTYCSPGSIGWYISSEYSYELVKCNPERALIQISRQEISPGENEEMERIWFYLLGLTEDGWRILDIIPFA